MKYTIANTVTPRIASLTPSMAPKARRMPTTSSAIVEIQPMATTNPTAHKDLCHFGGLYGEENVSRSAKATNPETRAYSIGNRSSLFSKMSKCHLGIYERI